LRPAPESSQWLVQLLARVGWQKAVVALANKNARILWAVLAKGRVFDPNHVSIKPGEILGPIPMTA
jgi:transposase